MKVKLKTWEQLQKEGFKHQWDVCYVGNYRAPDARFPGRFLHAELLGKEYELGHCTLEQWERDIAYITIKGQPIKVPVIIIENQAGLFAAVEKPKKFSLRGKEVTFYGSWGFSFPCSFQELTTADAKKLAQWILKVSP